MTGTTVRSKALVVADLMTRDVVTIHPEGMAQRAIDVMAERGIRHLVVVDSDEVVGVLSQRDVLRHMARRFTAATDPLRTRVNHFMSSPVATTTPDSPISLADFIMSERDIGCLPVLDGNNRLVGIVARSDVFQHVATSTGGGADESSAEP